MGKATCILLLSLCCSSTWAREAGSEAEARKFIDSLDEDYSKECNKQTEIRWAYTTNITDETSAASVS